jgi:hypothetical protein
MKMVRLEHYGPVAMWVLGFLIATLLYFAPGQSMTGDEPRYLEYAVSFWKHGRYQMEFPEWQHLKLEATGESDTQPIGEVSGIPGNGVYFSTVLSPIGGLFSLMGLRLATLAVGIIGLFCLYRLCVRVSSQNAALFATWVAALTIPLLPYLHVFYMETYLFALLCCVWERLQTTGRGFKGDLTTAFLLLFMPFIHMRASVIAAILFAILLWQLYRQGLRRRVVGFGVLAILALTVLIALNLRIYGAITGPVNHARPPWPWEWYGVVSMQLFTARHGLLAYAPIWLFGFSGLVVGAIRGPAVARQGALLAFVAAVTAVGPNAGECWPARFWVQSIPMLAVGLAIWWNVARLLSLRAITVALLAFTLINTVIFLSDPNRFLENRQISVTYQDLFEYLGHVHFGMILPVEADDALDVAATRNFAIGATVFIGAVVLAAVRRKTVYAAPAILLLVAVVDLARVRQVDPSWYRTAATRNRAAIELEAPMRAGYVQFGHDRERWYEDPWPHFQVTTTAVNGAQSAATVAANQAIPWSAAKKVKLITIESESEFDLDSEAKTRLELYRSTSLLRRWFPPLMRTP